jgi:hypothetical protein
VQTLYNAREKTKVMDSMQRRKFLLFSSFLGVLPILKAEASDPFKQEFKKVEPVIAAVQEHMFPQGSLLPSAKEMNVTVFLFETVAHKTFDKDIRAFVIEGAQELQNREKGRFTILAPEEMERALRAYEEDSYGRSWLARILTLTMEGMFGDPIYGSNIKEAGWQKLHSFGGEPRPGQRYIGT